MPFKKARRQELRLPQKALKREQLAAAAVKTGAETGKSVAEIAAGTATGGPWGAVKLDANGRVALQFRRQNGRTRAGKWVEYDSARFNDSHDFAHYSEGFLGLVYALDMGGHGLTEHAGQYNKSCTARGLHARRCKSAVHRRRRSDSRCP